VRLPIAVSEGSWQVLHQLFGGRGLIQEQQQLVAA
jgi:hypothetical protein